VGKGPSRDIERGGGETFLQEEARGSLAPIYHWKVDAVGGPEI